jgi:hypothetical protein
MTLSKYFAAVIAFYRLVLTLFAFNPTNHALFFQMGLILRWQSLAM